ncbi:MAG: DNA polymerase I [Lachnospiraceae bacterium]|nr:DNA polymerase I [Lachnospiraceae bacterium]
MKEKIILIDGYSILHRTFYGIPDLTNSEGLHTNAVYGFMNILFRILEEEDAQYLAVAFDVHAPTFRHRKYPEYKGTRKPMPDELREQIPVIKELLEAMGICMIMLEGYEADDLIGTVSRMAEEQGMQVCVLSGDRDLLQLSSDTTMIRVPKTKRTGTEIENYHTADVIEKYQVTPAQIIDLKGLMGDSSDNIPGIPGVGEKTATKIIVEYGSIENAYAHADEIKPNKARTSLLEHYDLAQLSKELATIDRHAPLDFAFEEARIGDLYTPQALVICKRLEFRNMLSRFEQTSDSGKDGGEIGILTQEEELRSFLAEITDEERAGLSFLPDPENTRQLLAAGLCAGGKMAVASVTQDLTQEMICSCLYGFLQTHTGCVIDLKESLQFLEGTAAEKRENLLDPAIGAYLINPLKGAYPYDDIAKDFTGKMVPSRVELLGKMSPAQAWRENTEACAAFLAWQAWTAQHSMDAVLSRLEETEMAHLFREIEMPLAFTLYDMQKEGIAVRGDELKRFSDSLQERIVVLEGEIYELAGEQFNINSPKQLGEILAEKMGIKGLKKTKTGYSTAADVLEKAAGQSPVIGKILEYRQLTKLKSTYADGLPAFISEDGRIHGKFNQTVTATGRISSADPNLQNIPVRTELGRELRKVFVPKDGCVFVDADYSQIELRVLAHASGDEKLIEAYAQSADIHAITASQVFHIPLDEVTPLDRRNAKAVNFGIVYGISSFGLSQDLSISRKEAQEYIEQYFMTYPGIKRFLDESVETAKQLGYVKTLYGRRRPVPELKSSNFMQRSFGERVAMNSPIQGTAADIIKIAMIAVHDRLIREGLRSRLILQIHDELLVETVAEETEQVKRILREEMMGAADLKVALEIDMHTGDSWYEAK